MGEARQVVNRFYIVIFSALDQTYCALVACDCQQTMLFTSTEARMLIRDGGGGGGGGGGTTE